MTTELAAPTPERTRWRVIPPLALVPLAALVWWVIGFLPWLLSADGRDVLAANGISVVALPLFSGGLSDLVLGAGFGSVAAGLAALLGTGSRAVRAGACAAGVAIALLATLLQSRSGVSDPNPGGLGIDERITNGLTIIVVVMTIAGLGLGLLGLTGRIGLGLALAAAAGAVPVWIMSVFNAVGLDRTADQLRLAIEVSRWTGAVAVAVTLIVVGLRPTGLVALWPVVVLLAWFVGPTITAAGYMQVFLRPGVRPADIWGEHLSATIDVWWLSASPELRPLTPWIVAVVVAGAIALWLARRPSTPPVP